MDIRLTPTKEETAGAGTVVYRVHLNSRWIGWVGDDRPWQGHRYGQRHWWAAWRETGDTAARWNTFQSPAPRTRKAALEALVNQVTAEHHDNS